MFAPNKLKTLRFIHFINLVWSLTKKHKIFVTIMMSALRDNIASALYYQCVVYIQRSAHAL